VLFDAERQIHLVERIAVVVSPGLTLTEPRAFEGPDTPVLAAGLSEARLGFSALPSVDEEVDEIAARFPTTKLMNEELTGPRLDEAVAGRAVGVIHVATHGEFSATASESFIVAWDEKLPMETFAATIARTARRNDAPLELLVLSACETAAGDERAALGLAGLAIQAGARSALATLWSVNDEATRLLIGRFYAELAQGRSRAEALRAAQRELIAHDTFSHPAFWSAFLLISSWL
jgi:CHAT domain-containing protein